MATVFNPNQNQEDEEQQNAPGAPTPTNPVAGSAPMSSAPAAAPTAVGGTQAPKAADPKQGSGRFTNIQKYLSANKNVDYAQKIGENVNQQNQKLQADLNQSKDAVQSQVNPELERLGNTAAISDTLSAAQQGNVSDEQAAAFNKYRTGDFVRNVGIQNEQDLASQQAQLAQNADLARSERGRFQMLRNTIGNGQTYNRGQNKLDQLLLQGQSGQLRNLNQTTSTAAQAAEQGLTGLRNEVGGYNADLTRLGTAAQEMAAGGVNKLRTDSETGLNERVKKEQDARDLTIKKAREGLAGGRISSSIAKQLGLENNTSLYGVQGNELANYLRADTSQVGRGNVATEADQARFGSLAKLLGGDQAIADFGKVGERLGGPISFAKDQFQSAVNANQSTRAQAERDTMAEYAPLLAQHADNIRNLSADYQRQVDYEQKYGTSDSGDVRKDEANRELAIDYAKLQEYQAAQQAKLNDLARRYGGTLNVTDEE